MKINIVIILFLIYFVLTMPKIINRKDLSDFDGRYYAHRGLHNNKSSAPENSLKAFKVAVEHDYGIELDVQITKDDIPIVFHDANLKRVCNVDIDIRDITFAELQKIKLFDSNEHIPLFTDVLGVIGGKVPVIIELKSRVTDIKICDIVAPILDGYHGVYCVESFNPLIVHWYKKTRPQVIRGQLSTNYLKDKVKNDRILNFLMQNLMFNFLTKPDFIAFNHAYSNMLSFNICRKVYKVPTFAYTINSIEDLIKRKDKFDYFIFEGFEPGRQ